MYDALISPRKLHNMTAEVHYTQPRFFIQQWYGVQHRSSNTCNRNQDDLVKCST